MSAQTYITPTLLAILAKSTFQLLYGVVAEGALDVANPQYRCNRADNFIAVSGPFCIAKKESLAKHLNLHRATLPLFLLACGDHFQWCAYSPYLYECNKRAQTAKTLRLFFCVQLSDVKTL
ncbi:hypothetical protein HU724_022045 [Pseudomonas iranensis]|uniref:hypothetical protein n=1 Tax=Pseudomonas iranensis TaxID=2745503 RepID=UPI001648DF72|nr:hypothetical protein [Pseudomonas iranensis]QXI21675.1 hypothetical protein HU724_022045 [Pseudomonas iranensis]